MRGLSETSQPSTVAMRRGSLRLLLGVLLSLAMVLTLVSPASARPNDKPDRGNKHTEAAPAPTPEPAPDEELIVEERVAEEVVVEEPVVQEAFVEEPVIEEVTLEAPLAEDALADEPAIEVVSADDEAVIEEFFEETPSGTTSLLDVASMIGAQDLWRAGFTGAGVDVALIDTGVAPVQHLSATNIVIGPDLSFEGDIESVMGLDTYGHGTHMAGIIAGRTPGAQPNNPAPGDFIGVAPDARLVSVKVGDNTGAVDVSQVIAAIDWVVQHRNADGMNIRVLNLAYNTDSTQPADIDPLSKAVENAWMHGIVVVTSAGNEGRSESQLANPATNPYVLAVSSASEQSNGNWQLPKWAPMGDTVRDPDVLAPGVSIASLRAPGSRVDVENPTARVIEDDQLFLGSGTSQSAAVVSGSVALLLEQRPELTPDQVKELLRSTATDAGRSTRLQGEGVINLVAAMSAPTPQAVQTWPTASGLGSLEASRDSVHVVLHGETVTGEITVNGVAWVPAVWVAGCEAGTNWSGSSWSGSSWSGATWDDGSASQGKGKKKQTAPMSSWTSSSWSGSSWSGSSWSGSSWSGSSWSGSSWSGSSWSGSSWSGSSWSGSSWSGSSWSGSSWSGSSWSGASWS